MIRQSAKLLSKASKATGTQERESGWPFLARGEWLAPSCWLRWLRPAEFSTRGGLAEFSRILLREVCQRAHASFFVGNKVAEFVRIPWRLHREEDPSRVRLDQARESGWTLLAPPAATILVPRPWRGNGALPAGTAGPTAEVLVPRPWRGNGALPAGTAGPTAEVLVPRPCAGTGHSRPAQPALRRRCSSRGRGASIGQSPRIGLAPEVGGFAHLDHGLTHRGHGKFPGKTASQNEAVSRSASREIGTPRLTMSAEMPFRVRPQEVIFWP